RHSIPGRARGGPRRPLPCDRSAWPARCVASVLRANWNFKSVRNNIETMKPTRMTSYPDISDILARKAQGRREISRRSFGEKIAMVEELRKRLAPLKRERERRAIAKPPRRGSAPRQ